MAFFLEPFWPALSGASPWRVGGVGSPARGCFAWKALAMSSDGGGGPPADPNEGSSPPRRRRRRRAAVPSGVSPPTGRQRVEGDAEQEPAAPPAPGGADALPPPLPVGPAAAPVAGAPGAAPALLAAAPAEAAGDADAVAGAETLPEEERPSDGLRRARFYLVTMVWCSVPHYVKPDSITRADFWGLICEAYRAVFPPENENHVGPNLGAVAKELHRNHEVHCMRHSHYHAACKERTKGTEGKEKNGREEKEEGCERHTPYLWQRVRGPRHTTPSSASSSSWFGPCPRRLFHSRP